MQMSVGGQEPLRLIGCIGHVHATCATGRAAAAVAIAAVTLVGVFAAPAGAKVLPYQLAVTPTTTVVGQPVTITMELDPQNALGEQFDFEIAIYRAKALGSNGSPEMDARPVERVVMTRSSDERVYEGAFTPKHHGRYAVVGASGRPAPATDVRCMPEDSNTQWRCWPAPVPIEVSRPRKAS
jgi:hypothetical protein